MKIFREVLVYPLKNKKILLIKKKRGLGKGLWNAPGGKIEDKESVENAAKREVKEETGLNIKKLDFVAFLEFLEEEKEEIHYVYIFLTRDFEGKIKESDEALPKWFDIDEIPFDKMWEDDKYWLPLVLKNKKIFGFFRFNNWKLKEVKIYEIKELISKHLQI